MPPKEDVAKEIGRVASTLTDDMQSAATKKARELGFDLNRGRLSLDETLSNLKYIRDVLSDATEKSKLIHLPLKLQYTLYSQTLKVSETLTALVNGTDAVQALEDVVDDLTSSAWQYNLHNLSGEVLGFQQKMNQLKNQEVLIRKTHRDAQEFETSAKRAQELLQAMEGVLTSAKERGDTIANNLEQTSAKLAQATDAEQKIAAVATQAEQHDATTARHEDNAKVAAAAAQTIADSLPAIKTQVETAKTSVDEQEARIKELRSTFEQTSTTTLTDFQNKYDEIRNATEAATTTLREQTTNHCDQLATAADKLLKDTADQLTAFQSEHDKRLNTTTEAINATARETIDKVNLDLLTALNEQTAKHEEQRTNLQKEYDRLVSELDQLEGQIKDSLRRATGFTLFHSFQKRQEALVASKNFWARALAGVVITSLALSVAFIIYVSSVTTFGPALYLKLSISLPIIYAIWFCSVQYSRERRLEEEYAFKSSISISLDPYRELVEKLVVKDKPEELAKYTAFIIESVGRVFTSPMETVFDHTKDATPAEGIIKAAADFAKDIIKSVK
jgi:chromosome segregation ATPase